MSELFSLQGKFYAATRHATTGKPLNPIWLGNASVATLALEVDKSDKNESFSGTRALYGSLQRSKSARLSMTLDELLPENFALALYAQQAIAEGGVAAAEELGSDLVDGDHVVLDHPFISELEIVDSAGGPVTLVEGEDYRIVSATRGIIELLDVSGHTQPYKASYKYADGRSLALFSTVAPPERYIIFDGINTVTGERILIDLYRMQFDPVTDFGLINEDWGGLPLEAVCLFDDVNAQDPAFGGFGRMRFHKPGVDAVS